MSSGEPFLTISAIAKRFGSVEVLRGVELVVDRGEVLALLGPSGSGKSTLLRILAGFETADAGRLLLSGREFTTADARKRGFGMVFQSYALFPHLSIGDNVGFGLDRLSKTARQHRVAEMLELVQLDGLEDRGIDQISGGQQQRVALARALAPEPPLLLLDEPLSNLDPNLRDRTRRQLMEIVRAVQTTTILVTHEQEEAFELGDRVAVLDAGRIEQVAPAVELYRQPATPFVARFIGRSNLLPCEVIFDQEEDCFEVDVACLGESLEIPSSAVIGSTKAVEVDRIDGDGEGDGDGDGASAMYRLWLRPEHLSISLTADSVETGTDDSDAVESAGSLDAVETSDSVRPLGSVEHSRLVGSYALVSVVLDHPGDHRVDHDAATRHTIEVAHRDPLAADTRVEVKLEHPEAARLVLVG